MLFECTPDVVPLFNLAVSLSLASLTQQLKAMMVFGTKAANLEVVHIVETAKDMGILDQQVDGTSIQFKKLSLLELGLMAALKKLMDRGLEEYNFAIMFQEYSNLVSIAIARDGFLRHAAPQAAMKVMPRRASNP